MPFQSLWHKHMSSIQLTHEAAAPAHRLSAPLIWLFAVGAGLAAAAIYYSQPMLGILGADMHAPAQTVGLVPTLTQLGYGLGILLLAPLGDRHDRRSLILIKAALLVLMLVASGLTPSMPGLLAASLGVGLLATLAQDLVPAAATLAPEAQRGKVVGTVMTGLLTGILLSRVVSGVVAEQFGWRAMFYAAAVSIAAIGVAAWRVLPRFAPTSQLSYFGLLASLWDLWRRHAVLRRAVIAQGLLALGFSAFWSTLAIMLHAAPFHLGSAAAGAFGLAGAAGALLAPLAGHLADKHGPQRVTRLGAGLAAASFALLTLPLTQTPSLQLWLVGLGAVGFDLGVQTSLIAHQTIVYGIDPGARSRMNAVLFVGMFAGMSCGALLGSVLLAHYGWTAVTGMATVAALAALGVRLMK